MRPKQRGKRKSNMGKGNGLGQGSGRVSSKNLKQNKANKQKKPPKPSITVIQRASKAEGLGRELSGSAGDVMATFNSTEILFGSFFLKRIQKTMGESPFIPTKPQTHTNILRLV